MKTPIKHNHRIPVPVWEEERILELPIVFTDRVRGVSKMSKNIIFEAAYLVWKLKLTTILTFGKR